VEREPNRSDEDLDSLILALRQVPANPNLVPAPELNPKATKGTKKAPGYFLGAG
jgi:hypothetical protein